MVKKRYFIRPAWTYLLSLLLRKVALYTFILWILLGLGVIRVVFGVGALGTNSYNILFTFAAILIIYYTAYWRSTKYHIIPDGIMIESGIFWQSEAFYPFSRIAAVHEIQNLFQQLVGTTTIELRAFDAAYAKLSDVPCGVGIGKVIKRNIRR